MAPKRLVADLGSFRKLLVGRTILAVEAGPSADGGEHLHLRLEGSGGGVTSVTISVGTVYGDLWYRQGH